MPLCSPTTCTDSLKNRGDGGMPGISAMMHPIFLGRGGYGYDGFLLHPARVKRALGGRSEARRISCAAGLIIFCTCGGGGAREEKKDCRSIAVICLDVADDTSLLLLPRLILSRLSSFLLVPRTTVEH